ncbi:glycine/D-amino acid oxidase-like deaminating enzyme [Chitinophaga niastensis]|uniref:Glycine/D-amino acid oxidase-like deaminating enzyme n=1 Tax=Chitinophaga niastensis TaxID=536980 RepID=A0A2P8HN91_CHINA|nr:FAD-dependent oxidoreductase [Chitinophaga niastensis]PSL47667.1 glycine/D-amino acid oxidase-like deaminating enzyme [Chitinophaga niastensis]
MLSYWEKQSLLHYDYIVIGSGIVGLSAAISVKEKAPQSRVMVLEREVLPTGASTKNAGFACIGSLTEILSDLQSMPTETVLNLVAMRSAGLHLLRRRLGDDNIGYQENGSYELIGTRQEWALQQLEEINKMMGFLFNNLPAFTITNEKINDFGFEKKYVKAIIRNNFEGELHTGKMMRALIDLAIAKGVEIKTGCQVSRVDDFHTGVNVIVPNHTLKEEIVFTASKVMICTNAFTRQLLPEEDVIPGRGQVLITAPVKDLPFKGIFHLEEGYYYFRELNGCVLLGGGRQLDFAGETSTDFHFNDRIQHELEVLLHTLILPGKAVIVADRWTGIMAFGKTKQPIVRSHTKNIILGVRMGGMGVAIGSMIGEKLAIMAVHS